MGGRLLTLIASFVVSCALLAAAGCAARASPRARRTTAPTRHRRRQHRQWNADAAHERGRQVPAVGTNPFVTTSYDPLSTFASTSTPPATTSFAATWTSACCRSRRASAWRSTSTTSPTTTGAKRGRSSVRDLAARRGATPVVARPRCCASASRRASRDLREERRRPTWCSWSTCRAACRAKRSCRSCSTCLRERWGPRADRHGVDRELRRRHAVRLKPTAVAERARIGRRIDGLNAAGSTAGAAGLELAYSKRARLHRRRDQPHRVVHRRRLQRRADDDEELLRSSKQKRETGVTLTALGFGIGNLNDSMMERSATPATASTA